jgi:hypothetical protein
MKLGISEILKKTSEIKSTTDKVVFLRQNDNNALKQLVKYALDPNIVWDLPATDPPYKPCPYPGQELRLMSEVRRLYLFIRGGNPNLTKIKRETLYIELLESVHPEDATLLNSCKNKKLPYKGLTAKLFNEAFPGLIEEKAGSEDKASKK